MDRNELVEYWKSTADSDLQTMNNLFNSKDYSWSLFIGHLVIEKMLKAVYVKNVGENVPKTHDLLRLAEASITVVPDDQKKDDLDLITTFNISARYPDYKKSFSNKCNEQYAKANIDKIKELKKWLETLL